MSSFYGGHRLTVEDIASLVDAAEERTAYRAPKLERMTPQERFLWDMFRRFPFRMRRIKRDMSWLDKHAKKRGLNLSDGGE